MVASSKTSHFVVNMRKFIIFCIVIASIFLMFSCTNKAKQSNVCNHNNDELYIKAMAILDEMGTEQSVVDFRKAYELLMTLPSEKNEFVSQLTSANNIFKKYDINLDKGSYYLNPCSNITQEGIDKYRSIGAYYDANDLLNITVYPALFKRYGEYAHCVNGITNDKITGLINSTNEYTLFEVNEEFNGTTKEWRNAIDSSVNIELKHHSNGLIESIEIPFLKSDEPISDSDLIKFYYMDADEQKEYASKRFMNIVDTFSVVNSSYTILSQLFNNEELNIIENYIRSLTPDEIWGRNLFGIGDEPTSYTMAMVLFDYKNKNIAVNYSANEVSLHITGENRINLLSHNWYTVQCALCLPSGDSKEYVIELYSDYIYNNDAVNNIVYEYSYDLDLNADKFITSAVTRPEYQTPDCKIEIFTCSETINTTVDNYEICYFIDTEFGQDIIIQPNVDVLNFSFFALDSDCLFNRNEYVISEVIYSCDILKASKPFLTHIYYHGYNSSPYGISFENIEGEKVNYIIVESYNDGKFYLEPF